MSFFLPAPGVRGESHRFFKNSPLIFLICRAYPMSESTGEQVQNMKKFAIFLLFPVLFSHFSAAPSFSAPEYLVTRIRITCSDGWPSERIFTSQESMGKILEYLRSVEFVDDSTEPVQSHPVYCIILTYSTGRNTVYQQHADNLLSRNGGRWHQLDPDQGKQLDLLYHTLPDEKSNAPVLQAQGVRRDSYLHPFTHTRTMGNNGSRFDSGLSLLRRAIWSA